MKIRPMGFVSRAYEEELNSIKKHYEKKIDRDFGLF